MLRKKLLKKEKENWILETQYKISVDPQYFKDLVIKNQNQELGELETVWFTQEMKNLRNLSDNSHALKNLALTLQKPEQEHLKNGSIEQNKKQTNLEEEKISSYQNNYSTQQIQSLNFSFIQRQQYQQDQQTPSSDFQQSSEREKQILPQLNQQIQSSLKYIETGNACEQQMPQLNYLQEQLQQQAQKFQQNSLNRSEQKQQQQQLQKQSNPQQIIDRVPRSIKIHCERINNGRKSRSASEDNIILKSPNKN